MKSKINSGLSTIPAALCVVFIILIIYKSWFTSGLISAGDLHYLSRNYLNEFVAWPQIWHDGNKLPSFNTYPIYLLAGIMAREGLSFSLIERLIWLFPFLFFSFFGTYRLSRRWMPGHWPLFSGLLYTVNTYSLMIIGGGQMGVALGYAFLPWVVSAFFQLFDRPTAVNALGAAIMFSIQIAYDLRMAYVTMICLAVVLATSIVTRHIRISKTLITTLLVTGIATAMLQAFWIFPYASSGDHGLSELGGEYTQGDALSFFSFADFSHSLSWLHPNWPENIFGKTYFLKPEFLLMPILAFMPLLLLAIKKSKKPGAIASFSLLALVGVFLSKGVNPPFGSAYRFLFEHIPGFIMFRDPTKFYGLISISYSILIPLAVYSIAQALTEKLKNVYMPFVVTFVVFFLYAVLLTPVIMGSVHGTLSSTVFPEEYRRLQQLLLSDDQTYRTLWIPQRSRFGYFSMTQSAVEPAAMLKASSPSAVADWFTRPETRSELVRYRIRYIVVPFDSEHELFLTDRVYDQTLENTYHRVVQDIPWLTRVEGFNKLTVMTLPSICPKIWVESGEGVCKPIDYEEKSSTLFRVRSAPPKNFKVVLSERYESGWVARGPEGKEVPSLATWDHLNSFSIPESWTSFTISYSPQRYVDIGTWVSIISFGIVGGYLLYVSIKAHIKAV